MQTIRVKHLSPIIFDAFKTGDFSKADNLRMKVDAIFMELSRQLRAKQISSFSYKIMKNSVVTWTLSLKNKDTVQKTWFYYSEDSKQWFANSDVQISSYEELIRETDTGITIKIFE